MKPLLAAAAVLLAAGPVLAQSGAPTPPTAPPAAAPAEGTGQIKAVDAKTGTVTIHHAPIASLGWPAMTMTFQATPEALKAAKTGQTVRFTVTTPDNQVVAIRPQ